MSLPYVDEYFLITFVDIISIVQQTLHCYCACQFAEAEFD